MPNIIIFACICRFYKSKHCIFIFVTQGNDREGVTTVPSPSNVCKCLPVYSQAHGNVVVHVGNAMPVAQPGPREGHHDGVAAVVTSLYGTVMVLSSSTMRNEVPGRSSTSLRASGSPRTKTAVEKMSESTPRGVTAVTEAWNSPGRPFFGSIDLIMCCSHAKSALESDGQPHMFLPY